LPLIILGSDVAPVSNVLQLFSVIDVEGIQVGVVSSKACHHDMMFIRMASYSNLNGSPCSTNLFAAVIDGFL